MNTELQLAIEKLKPMILEDAAKVRAFNRVAPITGERLTLPLEGRDIDVAWYRAKSEHAPLLIGIHGGGFLFGGSALDDALWVNVTEILDVNVASIDYRMSPQVMDYDSLYDVYDSIVYLLAHASKYDFDPSHVSVFGSSAGGNLAAAVAILAGQRREFTLDNQILMYPFLDGCTDPDSKGAGSFTGIMPHLMNQLHFSPDKADDPLLSPYFAGPEMLAGLAQAIVVYCENDNLRKEAQEYCDHLKAAGTKTVEMLAEKMPHGFIECGFKKELQDVEWQMLGENAEELVRSGLLRETSLTALQFVKEHMVR